MIISAKYLKPTTILTLIDDMSETPIDADGVYALHGLMQEYKALTGRELQAQISVTTAPEEEPQA